MKGDVEKESATGPSLAPAAGDLVHEESVLVTIKRALAEIEYGSIFIKIHQGKVVGLETSIKHRLDR